MIDKKIVIGIVLFIVGGLFVYSFANPLDQSQESDDHITPTTPIENPDTKKEEEQEPEVEQPKEEENNNTNTDTQITNNKKPNYNGNNSGSNTNNNNSNNSNSGNNDSTNTDNTTPPTPIVRPTVSKFGKANDETANVQIITSGNHITYKGEMEEKNPLISNGREYKDYINIMVTSPDTLTQEEFNNVKLTYRGTTYGSSEFYLDNSTGKAYFYLLQPFNRSNDGSGGSNLTTIGFDVYWGYGESVHYNITFDITVNAKATS